MTPPYTYVRTYVTYVHTYIIYLWDMLLAMMTSYHPSCFVEHFPRRSSSNISRTDRRSMSSRSFAQEETSGSSMHRSSRGKPGGKWGSRLTSLDLGQSRASPFFHHFDQDYQFWRVIEWNWSLFWRHSQKFQMGQSTNYPAEGGVSTAIHIGNQEKWTDIGSYMWGKCGKRDLMAPLRV